MGADFLLTHARLPWMERTEWRQIPGTLIMSAARKRAAALDFNGLSWLINEYENVGSVHRMDGEAEYEDLSVEERQAAIRRAIIYAVQTYVVDRSREVEWLEIGGERHIFTGGMSSGDSPTDAYEYISLLGSVSLFNEPLKVIADGP